MLNRRLRAELRDIAGNFKRIPSAKFETMSSEPRPEQRKNGQTVQSGPRFTLFRLNYIKIISVSIWIL